MIQNENEFEDYLTEIGLSQDSKTSYISRLRFLIKNNIDINSDTVNAENLFNLLETMQIQFKDRDSLKTALKTYKKFQSTDISLDQDLNEIKSLNITTTEKDNLIKARVGQGKYRKSLIALWGQCSISQLGKIEILIASHILPWRLATNVQRLDKFNGLLLQPNFDKLFDCGYISFNNDGTIILSNKINKADYLKIGVDENFKLFKVYKDNIPYLERHRELFRNVLEDKKNQTDSF